MRTNNDVEGYHRRLNLRIQLDHPAVYRLVEVLWQEARYVDVTAKLISSGIVRMERRKKTTEKQSRLEALWTEYEAGDLSTNDFLEEASNYAPA